MDFFFPVREAMDVLEKMAQVTRIPQTSPVSLLITVLAGTVWEPHFPPDLHVKNAVSWF